jgi:peptidylamidoglycolate lyase
MKRSTVISVIKKLLYIIAGLVVLILLLYIFQPIKKGKGLDNTVEYMLVENWPNLPNDLSLGNPTGIDIDSNQNIVVFHRAGREWSLLGSMPTKPITANTILIIDKDNGKLIRSWGSNLFIMPHGLTVDHENNIWVTDVGLHQVFKFSYGGTLLMKLGEEKVSGDDSLHFNKPTDIAIAKDGSFYVSDGYANSRVIKFAANGKYLFEWGKKGDEEGEFNIPHGITLDDAGNVYVADRENSRIQVFDSTGKFLKQYTDNSFGNFCAVAFDNNKSKLFAVDDFTFFKVKHRGSDVFVFDTMGRAQTRFGRSGNYKGSTAWYHDIVVDENENIYVGDILGNKIQKFIKIHRATAL